VWFEVSQGKSSQDPIPTNKKLDIVACTCHFSYAGNVNRRIEVQAGLGERHNRETLFKNT
jgi:hypothetical protein